MGLRFNGPSCRSSKYQRVLVACVQVLRSCLHTARPSRLPKPFTYATACSMNPVGLKPERFIIASSPEDPVVGFGQLLEHGKDSSELRSLFVKPEHRCVLLILHSFSLQSTAASLLDTRQDYVYFPFALPRCNPTEKLLLMSSFWPLSCLEQACDAVCVY